MGEGTAASIPAPPEQPLKHRLARVVAWLVGIALLQKKPEDPATSEALLWGVVASSSLAVGCLLALNFHLGRRALGLVMAFAGVHEPLSRGGKFVGVFTTLGFALAFAISALE